MTEAELKTTINARRDDLRTTGVQVKDLVDHVPFQRIGMDSGEVKANLILAYRHIEDARMRLGKAIQALEGGESIFDKPARTEDYHHPTA
jgi:hypothetical protein